MTINLKKKFALTATVLLLGGWGCQEKTPTIDEANLSDAQGQNPYFEQGTAKLTVKNQAKAPELVLPTVVATQDSWAVIRADQGGVPGEVLGYAAVTAGEHKDVKVKVDEAKLTPVVHANLYVDLGEKGTFENQGADVPVTANEVGISGSFKVEGVPKK